MTTNQKLNRGLGILSYRLGAIIDPQGHQKDAQRRAALNRQNQALKKPCPYCGQPAGQPCTTRTGTQATSPHRSR